MQWVKVSKACFLLKTMQMCLEAGRVWKDYQVPRHSEWRSLKCIIVIIFTLSFSMKFQSQGKTRPPSKLFLKCWVLHSQRRHWLDAEAIFRNRFLHRGDGVSEACVFSCGATYSCFHSHQAVRPSLNIKQSPLGWSRPRIWRWFSCKLKPPQTLLAI